MLKINCTCGWWLWGHWWWCCWNYWALGHTVPQLLGLPVDVMCYCRGRLWKTCWWHTDWSFIPSTTKHYLIEMGLMLHMRLQIWKAQFLSSGNSQSLEETDNYSRVKHRAGKSQGSQNVCVCLEWFGKTTEETMLWLSTGKKRMSRVAKMGRHSRQREQHGQSVRDTANNSIWPKQEGMKEKQRVRGKAGGGQGHSWEPVQSETFICYPEVGFRQYAPFSPGGESLLYSPDSQKGAWPSKKNQAKRSHWRILSRKTWGLNFLILKMILAAMWRISWGQGGVHCSSPGQRTGSTWKYGSRELQRFGSKYLHACWVCDTVCSLPWKTDALPAKKGRGGENGSIPVRSSTKAELPAS